MPHYTRGSVMEAINEIVKLVRFMLTKKSLVIKSDLSWISHLYPILMFDRRRL